MTTEQTLGVIISGSIWIIIIAGILFFNSKKKRSRNE